MKRRRWAVECRAVDGKIVQRRTFWRRRRAEREATQSRRHATGWPWSMFDRPLYTVQVVRSR